MLAIFIGAVVMFIFGSVWFTVLFGRKWVKLMDFNPASDEEARKKGMIKPMIMNFLLNVVVVSVVYHVYPQILALSFFDVIKGMSVIWLGFSFPIYANAVVWERKTWELVLLNSAQSFLSLMLVSYVIYLMM